MSIISTRASTYLLSVWTSLKDRYSDLSRMSGNCGSFALALHHCLDDQAIPSTFNLYYTSENGEPIKRANDLFKDNFDIEHIALRIEDMRGRVLDGDGVVLEAEVRSWIEKETNKPVFTIPCNNTKFVIELNNKKTNKNVECETFIHAMQESLFHSHQEGGNPPVPRRPIMEGLQIMENGRGNITLTQDDRIILMAREAYLNSPEYIKQGRLPWITPGEKSNYWNVNNVIAETKSLLRWQALRNPSYQPGVSSLEEFYYAPEAYLLAFTCDQLEKGNAISNIEEYYPDYAFRDGSSLNVKRRYLAITNALTECKPEELGEIPFFKRTSPFEPK